MSFLAYRGAARDYSEVRQSSGPKEVVEMHMIHIPIMPFFYYNFSAHRCGGLICGPSMGVKRNRCDLWQTGKYLSKIYP